MAGVIVIPAPISPPGSASLGNAVPVKFAQAVAEHLKQHMAARENPEVRVA